MDKVESNTLPEIVAEYAAVGVEYDVENVGRIIPGRVFMGVPLESGSSNLPGKKGRKVFT